MLQLLLWPTGVPWPTLLWPTGVGVGLQNFLVGFQCINVGETQLCFYTLGNGATVQAKVMKNHGNGKYDIQFQQDGNDVVRLSVPSAKLQIA